jgi:hypothetical protein
VFPQKRTKVVADRYDEERSGREVGIEREEIGRERGRERGKRGREGGEREGKAREKGEGFTHPSSSSFFPTFFFSISHSFTHALIVTTL